MNSADQHVTCGQGHEHWGRLGAAGLLLYHRGSDKTISCLLQKRSQLVLEPGTWSIPGGAIADGERPEEAALREFAEETGGMRPFRLAFTLVDDHGGWAYTTVAGEVEEPVTFTETLSWESDGCKWATEAEMAELPLHPGFTASLGRVMALIRGEVRARPSFLDHKVPAQHPLRRDPPRPLTEDERSRWQAARRGEE